MTNLIESLHLNLGLSTQQISDALARHSNTQQLSPELVAQWLAGNEVLPSAVKRAAALVVIEHWMKARDSCGPTDLLAVDKTYTRLLRDFSMVDIIALRRQLVAEQH